MQSVLLIAFAAAALCFSLFSGRAPLRPTAEASSAADPEIERMRMEIDAIRRELQQSRREAAELRALVSAETRAPHGEETGALGQQEPPDGAPQEPTLQPIDGFAEDVARFEAEPSDRTWDPSPQLHGALTASLPKGSSILSLECRSSLCRLETTHADPERYQAFTRLFTFFAGEAQVWKAGATFGIDREPAHEGDPLRTVAYLHRDDDTTTNPTDRGENQ